MTTTLHAIPSDAAGLALAAQRLCVELGSARSRRRVLDGVDVAIRAGRWTSIVGPNGAGKSTLLRALAGLVPAQGSVFLLGRPLAQWSHRERARTLAWLAQGGVADAGADDLTVLDVAMLGRLPHRGWLAPPSPADLAAVEAALRQTQAWEWRERAFGALSGGERQRVLLARLLAVQAPVLLMDEPLAHLDPPHQADWVALVRALVAQGSTVVSVLHDLTIALQSDELLILSDGVVRYQGSSAAAQSHRALEAVFDHRIRVVPSPMGLIAVVDSSSPTSLPFSPGASSWNPS
jgi:iron complex transport system ATP-binding protein